MAHLSGGDFGQEIVGESHYFKTLARCFKVGRQDASGKRSYMTVKLVLENNNKHDKNAVAIVSEFGTVGYLSRIDAKLYRKLYGNNETHTTDAVIYSRDGTKFGVWIDVCLDEDLVDEPINKPKKASNPTKQTNAPVERPIILEPKQPPTPPKAWKDQSVSERIGTVIGFAILLGVLYLVFASLRWFFGLFS